MAAGLAYNYAAKQVDEKVLDALVKLQRKLSLERSLQLFTMEK